MGLATPTRYSQMYRQLGEDVAGIPQETYRGYMTGRREAEQARLRGIQTTSAELSLQEMIKRIEKSETDEKEFQAIKREAVADVKEMFAGSAKQQKVVNLFQQAKDPTKLSLLGFNLASLQEIKQRAAKAGIKIPDWIPETLPFEGAPELFQKSFEEAQGQQAMAAGEKAITEGGTAAQMARRIPAVSFEEPGIQRKYGAIAQAEAAERQRAERREREDVAALNRDIASRDKIQDNVVRLETELQRLNKGLSKAEQQVDYARESMIQSQVQAANQQVVEATEAINRIKAQLTREKEQLKITNRLLEQNPRYEEAMKQVLREREIPFVGAETPSPRYAAPGGGPGSAPSAAAPRRPGSPADLDKILFSGM